MSLTDEEQRKIYEEEKARLEIRQQLEAKSAPVGNPLDTAIADYTSRGFIVESRTATTAQLRKPKQFNVLYAIVNWLLLSWILGLGIFLFILQVILHVGAKDQIVMLAVENGAVVQDPRTPSRPLKRRRESGRPHPLNHLGPFPMDDTGGLHESPISVRVG